MKPRFEVFRKENGTWMFELRSSNGRVLIKSKSYFSKRNAFTAIDSLRDCVLDALVWETVN